MWHCGSGACTAAPQHEGHVFDSHMGRCWLWGACSPQTFSAQVGYLPGLSVWSLHVLPRPSVLRWAISQAFLCVSVCVCVCVCVCVYARERTHMCVLHTQISLARRLLRD